MARERSILERVRRMMTVQRAKCIKTSGEGEPDLVCCLKGRTVVIETKQPGKLPTPLQRRKLWEWHKSGAFAFWTDHVDHLYGIEEVPQ
jgi:hypothetical protein